MKSNRLIVNLCLALTLIAFVLQCAIDGSIENIAAACVVLASALSIILYIHWTAALSTHPLSTFAIFGFCVTTQLGALLAQTAALTSFSTNLQQPLETFSTLAFYQALALLTHIFYRLFSRTDVRQQTGVRRGLLERAGVYASPSAATLWLMGGIGFISFFLGSADQDVADKLAQGFWFLAWSPFLIPMYVLQRGPSYCNAKKNYLFLFFYMGLIMLFGISVNARGVMLSGVMTVTLFVLLTAMRSTAQVPGVRLIKLCGLLAVFMLLSIPVSNLATAMAEARKVRGNISTVEMVQETMYYFQQPALLQVSRDKERLSAISKIYNEYYFSSNLIGRLVETKFHDNALYFANRLSQKDVDSISYVTNDFMWATLPEPLLKMLGVEINKKYLKFTMGDYIMHMSSGLPLQGFKTGSVFAQGPAIFGALFPFVYIGICLILFNLQDMLSRRMSKGKTEISALGMLGIWNLFQYGMTSESLQKIFTYVVRGYPQNIVIFLLVMYFSTWLTGTLGSILGRRSSQPARGVNG